MISLTNKITMYFSASAKELRLNKTKKSLLELNFETWSIKIASNMCLYLKTSLALSTPLTNTIIR